jgi:hypothetical protein
MNALHEKFPHLDHFLNAYMHQDWMLAGDSLQDVIHTYARENSPEDARELQVEIGDFITLRGKSLEADYYALFPNSVTPSGWNMKVDQWLCHVAELAGRSATVLRQH